MTWELLAAVAVGTVAVARATRLITSDAWPPMVWGRVALTNAVSRLPGDWTPLWICPFCVAPYAAAVDLAWAVWAGAGNGAEELWSPDGMWWLVNLWAAVSYLAAMIVVRDEPPAEEE